MNDKPMWVGGRGTNGKLSKGLFRYARNGYIPALELPEQVNSAPERSVPFIPNDHIVALVTDLQNRLNRHIDASKKKDRL